MLSPRLRAHGRCHRRRPPENTDSVSDARGFSDRQTLNRFGERSCVGGHENLRRRRACTSVFVELVVKPFGAASPSQSHEGVSASLNFAFHVILLTKAPSFGRDQ